MSNLQENVQNSIPTIENKDMLGFFKKSENRVAALLISIIIGTLFSVLVIKDYIALNFFLFSLSMIVAVGYVMHKDNNLKLANFAYFATAFLIYASIFFRLKNEAYQIFTVLLLPSIFVFVTIFSAKTPVKSGIVTVLFRFFGSIAFVDKIFIAIGSFKKEKDTGKQNFKQVLIGVVISLGLLAIILPLMSSADVVFGKIIKDIIKDFEIVTFVWKAIASCAVAILFFGFLYIVTVKKQVGRIEEKKSNGLKSNHITVLTIISILATVFTLFAIVQFNYLFAKSGVLPEGYSYTEYARKGYFELVFLSIINFAIILSCVSLLKTDSKKTKNFLNILLSYFNLLNLYLVASATYKMSLYQTKYGFTVLRMLVYLLIIFEVIALIGLMIKIYRKNMPFIKYMIYYSIGFWAVVSLINIEAWVVGANINRFDETGDLFMENNLYLSEDASEQLKRIYIDYYDELDEDEIKEIYKYYYCECGCNFFDEKSSLNEKNYEKAFGNQEWLGFNFLEYKKYNDGKELISLVDKEEVYKTGYKYK